MQRFPKWLAAAVLVAFPAAGLRAETPAGIVALAHADVSRIPAGTREYVRYLSLGHLPVAHRAETVQAIAFWCNSLSRNSEIVRPVLVGPNQSLIRINLLDYGWKVEQWEKLADIDPYYHQVVEVVEQKWYSAGYYGGRYYHQGYYPVRKKVAGSASWLPPRESAELIELTQSRSPILRADWWFVQTVRQLSLANKEQGVGYYDWLGVKSRGDFFRLLKLSEKDSLEIGREMRAAVLRSGVATQNRQIVRLQALTGGAWVTLDTDDSSGKGNAIERLKRGEFVHKAEEHYGTLPNGLFAYLLCDDRGNLQPSAPDFIGADDSPLRTGRDARIHAGLSCVRCHVEGLRPVDDWVRKTLRNPLGLQSPDYKQLLDLRRQYFSNMEGQIEKDRSVFVEAVFAANGLTPAANAKAVARTWDRYVEQDRGLDEISAELGYPAADVLASLKRYARATGYLPPELAGLLQDPPIRVRIEHWERMYPRAQEIVRGYK